MAEDAAAALVPSPDEVGSPQSALHENIARKGANSYYYAHKNTSTETIKTTLNEAPRLLAKEEGVKPVEQKLPVRGIKKYAWADDGAAVKVYIDVPGAKELPADAVSVEHTESSVKVGVKAGGEELVLSLTPLHAAITGATAKRGKDRLIVTLTKADSLAWWALVKGGARSSEDEF